MDASRPSERWRRTEAALDLLLDLPPAKRERKLREIAAQDSALERELRSLIAYLEPARDPLEEGVAGSAVALLQGLEAEVEGERAGRHGELGPYTLGELLAVGGMGRVYRAHRRDGLFEREVAVKVMRWEIPDPSLRARFDQERRILARLQHPAVAQLIDGGVTADGLPYLVMELVVGEPLDLYCRRLGFSPRERLELLLPIVDAVAYAHRQLVVHRDLKPGNVLVDAAGRAKLLDFGVAKLVEPSAETALAAGLTITGSGPYTPAFASPEQLAGKAVGTASDVYSLGAVVYLLVTDVSPFPPLEPGQVDPRLEGRLPVPPSRVSPRLPGPLAQDLDAIVLKAMRPEAEERYSGVDGLATDIRHLLGGRAVEAVAPTLRYRLRKLIRRNPMISALVSAVVLAIALGILASSHQARLARQERDRAVRMADFAFDVLRLGDPRGTGATQLPAKELLVNAAAAAENLADSDLRGQALTVVGEGLSNLYAHGEAAEVWSRASAAYGYPDLAHPQVAEVLRRGALAWAESGNQPRALEINRQALAAARLEGFAPGAELAPFLFDRAYLILRFEAKSSPRREEAESLLEEAVELQRRDLPSTRAALASSLHLLGRLRFDQGFGDTSATAGEVVQEGLDLMAEAAEIRRQLPTDQAGALVESLSDRGLVLDVLGRHQEALETLEEALDYGRRWIDPSHPILLTVGANLGAIYFDAGRFEDAQRVLQAAASGWQSSGTAPPAGLLHWQGQTAAALGRQPEAEALARRALASAGEEGPRRCQVALGLGDILLRAGQRAEARRLLSQTLPVCEAAEGADSRQAARVRSSLRAIAAEETPP
ncbi:MAG: serine/threonine-protein kinase [Acidobacteriota bacterium]